MIGGKPFSFSHVAAYLNESVVAVNALNETSEMRALHATTARHGILCFFNEHWVASPFKSALIGHT